MYLKGERVNINLINPIVILYFKKFLIMENILVTGHDGFLGSHLGVKPKIISLIEKLANNIHLYHFHLL